MKYPNVAKRFRDILALRNMKQQELADKAGVHKSFISHYVNGTHCPSNIKAQQLADVLDVSPLWLMDLSDHMEKEKPTAQMSDELASFIEAYESASPTLRNAALSVLKSGAPADETPPMRPDTAQ